jgi:phosphoglycolate phosphatase
MFEKNKLVILDADGTTINAFQAIASAFSQLGMSIGDLQRFQKRHNLFKYLGGVKELPKNLKNQLKKVQREKLIDSLTDVYREQATLYEGMADMVNSLAAQPDVIVGVVTRNITREPQVTLSKLFSRHGIATEKLDFLIHLELKEKKTETFRRIRNQFNINPALAYVCGDENKDYVSAVAAGMHPFIVSYGFESYERLTEKFDIPTELISTEPAGLRDRLLHAVQQGL